MKLLVSFKWNNTVKEKTLSKVLKRHVTCHLLCYLLVLCRLIASFLLNGTSHLSLADPLASEGLCFAVCWVFICRNNACCFSHSVFVHHDPKFNTSFLIFYIRKCQCFETIFPLRPTSTEDRNNDIACLYAVLWAKMNDVPMSSANCTPLNYN